MIGTLCLVVRSNPVKSTLLVHPPSIQDTTRVTVRTEVLRPARSKDLGVRSRRREICDTEETYLND